jgi:hypothetical protein
MSSQTSSMKRKAASPENIDVEEKAKNSFIETLLSFYSTSQMDCVSDDHCHVNHFLGKESVDSEERMSEVIAKHYREFYNDKTAYEEDFDVNHLTFETLLFFLTKESTHIDAKSSAKDAKEENVNSIEAFKQKLQFNGNSLRFEIPDNAPSKDIIAFCDHFNTKRQKSQKCLSQSGQLPKDIIYYTVVALPTKITTIANVAKCAKTEEKKKNERDDVLFVIHTNEKIYPERIPFLLKQTKLTSKNRLDTLFSYSPQGNETLKVVSLVGFPEYSMMYYQFSDPEMLEVLTRNTTAEKLLLHGMKLENKQELVVQHIALMIPTKYLDFSSFN